MSPDDSQSFTLDPDFHLDRKMCAVTKGCRPLATAGTFQVEKTNTPPRPVLDCGVMNGDCSVEVMPRHFATIFATQPAFLRMGLMFVGLPMESAKQCVMVTGLRDRGRPCSGVCMCVRTWVLC